MNYLARALEQEEEEREDDLSPGLEMRKGFGFPPRQSEGLTAESKAGGKAGMDAVSPDKGEKETEGTEGLPVWAGILGETLRFLPEGKTLAAEAGAHRGRAGDGPAEGWAPLVREEPGTLALAVGRAERNRRFVQEERRRVQVTLPEEAAERGGGITLEELDRAVERDSRRYDGESGLY